MAELAPVPFPDLLRRMRAEARASQAIFDLPAKKFFTGEDGCDFSVRHFGRPASTPVGPAAGPHTQLAQNIVLSWLAGSRIIELKTVQVNDRLEIPRPCIQVPNVGYNVEWSQELLVEQSAREYAKAVFLVEVLKSTRAFGLLPEGFDAFDTIYDLSVGYDLEGIRSPKVDGFIQAMRQPVALFDELRAELDGDLAEFQDLELPGSISDCVTLSTFHGCPADQIEAISRHLIETCGLDTIIKLNPTLLGYDAVAEILYDKLGYTHLELDRHAFDVDLRYDDGLAILRRLHALSSSRVAAEPGRGVGAKFTNTLVVKNRPDLFPTQTDPYMYVSGQPLHVISMTLMQRMREDLGFELPVSFSAGIDARNFPAAVACGMVPITTCTDLLRQGGYARLPVYLKGLAKEMRRLGVTNRDDYVRAAFGHGEESNGDVRTAGRLNCADVVPGLAADPRYHASRNSKEPRRIDSRLALYDCINCDLCISACPNDAIFAYDAEPAAAATAVLSAAGEAAGRGYSVRETHQLAVYEAACNDCSNCETWCPEDGAPFRVKELLFGSAETLEASALDGFYRDGDVLLASLEGWRLRLVPGDGGRARLEGRHGADRLRGTLAWPSLGDLRIDVDGAGTFDTALLRRMRTVWEHVYHGASPSMVRLQKGPD